MYIFETLRQEHENIHEFTYKMEALAIDVMEHNKVDYEAFAEGISFIRNYADRQHHQKEEEILFSTMNEELDDIARNIINHGMLVEHTLARGCVWDLEASLKNYKEDPSIENKLAVVTYTMSYVYLLRKHIDKENNVLYPYGEKNLKPETIARLDEAAKEYDKKIAAEKAGK